MTEWLVGLSLFNLASVVSLFMPRAVTRTHVPWVLFAISLLASELAWLWLVVQIVLAAVFVLGGAASGAIGEAALLALCLSWLALAWSMHLGMRAEGVRRKLVCLTLADPAWVALGGEPVRAEDRVVGRVTSGGFGYSVGLSIAYAYLPVELANPGTPVAVEFFGEWVEGRVAAEPLWDPRGDRVRQ